MDTGKAKNMKYNTGKERNRENDSSSARTWERLTLKHPSARQTGSVCNSLSTKTHSVYLGQQEEGPREEKSKSQHKPSLGPQLYTQLCTVLSLQHFQLSFLQSCTQLLWAMLLDYFTPSLASTYQSLIFLLLAAVLSTTVLYSSKVKSLCLIDCAGYCKS